MAEARDGEAKDVHDLERDAEEELLDDSLGREKTLEDCIKVDVETGGVEDSIAY